MRQGWVWAVSIAAVVSISACNGKPAEAAPSDDVLVLEVGGKQSSLRAALVALGRVVPPGHALTPRQEVVAPSTNPVLPRNQVQPIVGEEPADPEAPVVVPEPVVPDAPPESPWVIVKLAKGETPIHLAQRYLGNGRRFQEVMKWNGWSERDTRYLKPNQDVKIKRSEMR